jgi:hypothetical protein
MFLHYCLSRPSQMHKLQCEENAKPQVRDLILPKLLNTTAAIFLIMRILGRAWSAHVGRLRTGLAHSREYEVQRATLMGLIASLHVRMDEQSVVSRLVCFVAMYSK